MPVAGGPLGAPASEDPEDDPDPELDPEPDPEPDPELDEVEAPSGAPSPPELELHPACTASAATAKNTPRMVVFMALGHHPRRRPALRTTCSRSLKRCASARTSAPVQPERPRPSFMVA